MDWHSMKRLYSIVFALSFVSSFIDFEEISSIISIDRGISYSTSFEGSDPMHGSSFGILGVLAPTPSSRAIISYKQIDVSLNAVCPKFIFDIGSIESTKYTESSGSPTFVYLYPNLSYDSKKNVPIASAVSRGASVRLSVADLGYDYILYDAYHRDEGFQRAGIGIRSILTFFDVFPTDQYNISSVSTFISKVRDNADKDIILGLWAGTSVKTAGMGLASSVLSKYGDIQTFVNVAVGSSFVSKCKTLGSHKVFTYDVDDSVGAVSLEGISTSNARSQDLEIAMVPQILCDSYFFYNRADTGFSIFARFSIYASSYRIIGSYKASIDYDISPTNNFTDSLDNYILSPFVMSSIGIGIALQI